MDDDSDRDMILARRARWVAMALSVAGAQGCHEPEGGGAPATTHSGGLAQTATAAEIKETARPTACLSYSCPPGSVHVLRDGRRGGDPMTARPEAGDCAPRASLENPDAPARVEPGTTPSSSAKPR